MAKMKIYNALILFILIPLCQANSSLPAPILRFPESGVQIAQIGNSQYLSFIWDHVLGAVGYRLQIAEKTDFSQCIIDSVLIEKGSGAPACKVDTTTLGSNKSFVWRVSAKDKDEVYGKWSGTFTFTLGFPDAVQYSGIKQNKITFLSQKANSLTLNGRSLKKETFNHSSNLLLIDLYDDRKSVLHLH